MAPRQTSGSNRAGDGRERANGGVAKNKRKGGKRGWGMGHVVCRDETPDANMRDTGSGQLPLSSASLENLSPTFDGSSAPNRLRDTLGFVRIFL